MMRCNILILFNKKVRRNLTFNVVSILFNEVMLSSILKIHIHIKGLEIAKEFTFVESSFHGKRTKFYEAVNYIKRQSKLTALVVDTVDRLQRTFNEFPMLLELVKKEKLALHFFKEGLVIDKNFKSSDLAMWQMQILSAICLSIQLGIMLSVPRREC